jgi:hypothetical protein
MESGPGVPGGMIGIVNEGMVLEVNEVVVVCWSGNGGAFGVIGTIEIGVILMVGVVEIVGLLEGVVAMLPIAIGEVIGVACIVLMFDTFKI